MVRRLLLGASLVVLGAALVVVPLPLVELAPGPAIDAVDLVHFERPPADRVTGRLLLTTVDLSEPSVVDATAALLTGRRQLLPRSAVVPPGVDEREYLQAELDVFRESAEVATAVGLRAAGCRVTISGRGAQIVDIVRHSPADGVLRVGDVITAVDGRPVRLASDVQAATARASDGGAVLLTVRRVDRRLSLRIVTEPVSALGRPGLGVAVRTLGERIRLPFRVRVDQEHIGGPSAGLMMALAVYDLAQPGDVTHGRAIAGTGTIDVNGAVGPIGGIQEKVVGASRAGATLFLAPRDQATSAASAAPTGVRVIPVSSFDDAVRALGGARPSPGCEGTTVPST